MNTLNKKIFTFIVFLILNGLFVTVFGNKLFELPSAAFWAFGIVTSTSILCLTLALDKCKTITGQSPYYPRPEPEKRPGNMQVP